MKNVKTGERVRLSASDVNAWNAVAIAYREGKFQNLEEASREGSNPVIITIQNKTDSHIGIFSVLALGQSVKLTGNDIDKAKPKAIDGEVIFEGNVPTNSESETACITLNAAGADTLVPAVIAGAVGCVVNVTNTSHRYAIPVPGDVKKLQSSESGAIRILNPVETTGEQFCYVLLGVGGGTAADTLTVPVFYPARQEGSENAHGLTNEGTRPFEAGDGIYYKNIQPVIKERFVQPDGDKWKFEYVDGTPCTLENVALEYANQTMTGWETTDDVDLALKYGHRLIVPHHVVGYTLGNSVTFKNTGSVVVPIVQSEFHFAPIFAEVDVTLRKQDGTVIDTVEELIDAGTITADLPEYQNDKPVVKDTKSIENNCTGKVLLGLWRDGSFPQLLFCETIPFGYCIPLQTITALVRVKCDDCSPVYNPNKYTVAISEIEGNKIFVPLNVDYKPSIRCPE